MMVTASVIELRLSFRRAVTGAKLPIANGTNRPIVLKKSASVSTAEKFAPELEICVLGRRFTARISRGCTQNRRFSYQYPSVLDKPAFSTQSAKTGHSRGLLRRG